MVESWYHIIPQRYVDAYYDMNSGYLIGICNDNKIRIHDEKGKKQLYEHDTLPQ